MDKVKIKSYGAARQREVKSSLDGHLENLEILGYTVIEGVLRPEECDQASSRLDAVYREQEEQFGRQRLADIQELNLARCPLSYDEFFLGLATAEPVLELVRATVGNYFVLHLQNGIINIPEEEHHQSSWHRDLPYQDFVSSKPLAVSALFCLDDFTLQTGGTHVLPRSHAIDYLPSPGFLATNETCVVAPRGSVLFFNAMLYHRAGRNRSRNARRGVNHVYTTGILRQQIDLPRALEGRHSQDPFLRMLLGYENQPEISVDSWRRKRLDRGLSKAAT